MYHAPTSPKTAAGTPIPIPVASAILSDSDRPLLLEDALLVDVLVPYERVAFGDISVICRFDSKSADQILGPWHRKLMKRISNYLE